MAKNVPPDLNKRLEKRSQRSDRELFRPAFSDRKRHILRNLSDIKEQRCHFRKTYFLTENLLKW
jgi:hypothetical protein